MNKRIRELIAQAREPLRGKDLSFNQGLLEYSEKFAELIVKECIDILETPGAMKVDESTLSEFSEYNQGWVNGRKLGIAHLKDNFAIKDE